ncbi:LLM class flavin-dependent oxidoreductase [Rhodococcus sp. RS1C4]|nr:MULTISPECIES: LLM class flavin-dependent oxidoreductase [unclassified Rhodococcus (in: high G+C Gram-positive bacteria)]OZC48211.1 LLM class flavin-dependent oxidoreductase [Rhodococcus sp. 06-621-2]OZC51671.1 LLM class flavin-dependent oxidoreductase [Rhodococcus sp. RS1C4]OZC86775.1 LLM class flavin-dependent oxidoreductase [Rhodococcus sp. 06-418-1B]
MTRRIHLNVNILNSGVFGGSWRFPGTDPFTAFGLDHYVGIAKKAEAATLDAVFLADGPVLAEDVRYRTFNSLEPTVVLAAVAASTSHIGLIGTLSSSYNDPYDVARRLATLDRLSGGRSGFNVVTTAGAAAARNFGCADEPEHGERYRRAAEFVDVVRTLWNSWAEDALVGDRDTHRFVDTSKIRDAHYDGTYFQVEGALNVPRSPQGEPVLVQAGASKDGRELAARVGEVIFTASQTIPEAREYYQDVKRRAAGLGRDPGQVVILPGLSTVVGSTEKEAQERRELLDELVPPAYALGRLAGQLGVPADSLDLDGHLPWDLLKDPDEAGGSQTFYRIALGLAQRENLTVRALLKRLGGGAGHRIVTGTPEQIADDIIEWVDAGVADGFNLMPDVLPSGFDDFADHVVPELRRRGRFRTEYTGSTLRENLGLRVPPFARGGARVAS